MKGYKWYWTPKGWLVAIIAIGLLIGAAFMNGAIAYTLLALGILTLIYAYGRTVLNANRVKREVERREREKELENERLVDDYLKKELEREQGTGKQSNE